MRPATSEELSTSLALNTNRLLRGVAEMDAGSPEAIFDVVAALRQLVAHGDGNHLLQRTAPVQPRVSPLVEQVAKRAVGDVRFELGALPAGGTADLAVAVDEMLKLRCLRIVSRKLQEEVVYTWDGLISMVANKLGAIHTDAHRAEILDDLACYMVAGVPALRYALRTIGAEVGKTAASVVGSLGHEVRFPVPDVYRDGEVELHSLRVVGSIGGDMEITAGIRHRGGRAQQVAGWIERGDPDWLFHPPADLSPFMTIRSTLPAGRNDACPCGSGLKHKKCCGR
jgi:hypothetical protein